MKGTGQCYDNLLQGFLFYVLLLGGLHLQHRHMNVLYLLKNSETQHQVVNTADLSVSWWDTNNAVKLIRLLLGK